MKNVILNTDALSGLKAQPDESIQCCITSPPYYALRDYGVEGQIGLEADTETYIHNLATIFDEVYRVLKKDGTLWVNIGDSYAGSNKGAGDNTGDKWMQHTNKGTRTGETARLDALTRKPGQDKCYGLKPKDLIGIPWMLAFELRKRGWYLRQDIIWAKPNPMPESVTDRCTKAHEYIFLLSKSQKYYYDAEAIKTPLKDTSIERLSQQIDKQKGSDRVPGKTNGNMKAVGPGRNPRKGVDVRGGNQGSERGIPAMAINGNGVKGHSGNFDAEGNLIGNGMANKKSVWTVSTKPFKQAHFATFPEELIVDCIKAGTKEGETVLDPFGGQVLPAWYHESSIVTIL